MSNISEQPTAPEGVETRFDRAERGRRSVEDGSLFEQRVAELYRLQGYEVEHGRLFSGRQVDLFITRKIGDYMIQRAIECKAGRARAEDIDSFYGKLRVVQAEYPRADGTIISNDSFSDAITSQAHTLGIQLTLFSDLAANLFDGNKYAHWLVRELETNARYSMPLYIEPVIGYDPAGNQMPALEFVNEWLQDPEWNQFTLLGDVGTGKSFLSRMIAHHLARRYQRRPLENPLPVLIDLRNADRQFSLEGLILTHLSNSGVSGVSFEAFEFALKHGNVVLILDGFDEMAALVTPQITLRNFHELARGVEGRAKVLLTCRTHYFKSRTEEEEVILGRASNYSSESARELYWDLISRRGFKIGYLRPFERAQIEAYVRQVKGPGASAALAKIRRTYNLMELSQRPMLLDMIVRSLDKLTDKEINQSTLYQVYTDAWIHRDHWREVLSPESKLALVTAIALDLWENERTAIHHSQLEACLRSELAAKIQDPRQFVEIDHEIRTASFLTRDEAGNYGFAHKSYSEFFVARHLAAELQQQRVECLMGRRLSPEVVSFLRFMVEQSAEVLLESILTGEYRPMITENALSCLYGFRRGRVMDLRSSESETVQRPIVIPLPSRMRLAGAQLDQALLEGAQFADALMDGARMSQANLAGATLERATLCSANLDGATLVGAGLQSCNLSGASLRGTNLEGADLTGADLTRADLSDAYLLTPLFEDVILDGATLIGALLPDTAQGRIVQFWQTVESMRPWMLRTAGAVDTSGLLDPEEVVSDVALTLGQPEYLNAFLSHEERQRRYFVLNVIRRRISEVNAESRRHVSLDSLSPEEIHLIVEPEWNLANDVSLSSGGAGGSPDERWLSRIYNEELLSRLVRIVSAETMRIILLRYEDDLPVRAIAEELGISASTVQRHLRKGRQIVQSLRSAAGAGMRD